MGQGLLLCLRVLPALGKMVGSMSHFTVEGGPSGPVVARGGSNSWMACSDYGFQSFGGPESADRQGSRSSGGSTSFTALKKKGHAGSNVTYDGEPLDKQSSATMEGCQGVVEGAGNGFSENGKEKNLKNILSQAMKEMKRQRGKTCSPTSSASLLSTGEGSLIGEKKMTDDIMRGRGKGIVDERSKVLFPDGRYSGIRRVMLKNSKNVKEPQGERSSSYAKGGGDSGEGTTEENQRFIPRNGIPIPCSPKNLKSTHLPQVNSTNSSNSFVGGGVSGAGNADPSQRDGHIPGAGREEGEVLWSSSSSPLMNKTNVGGDGKSSSMDDEATAQRRQEASQLFLHDHREAKGQPATTLRSSGAGPYTVGHISPHVSAGKVKEANSCSNTSSSPYSKKTVAPEPKNNCASSPTRSRMSDQVGASFNDSFRLRQHNGKIGNYTAAASPTNTSASATTSVVKRKGSHNRMSPTSPRRGGSGGGRGSGGRGSDAASNLSSLSSEDNTNGAHVSASSMSILSFNGSIRQNTEKANLLDSARAAVVATLAESSADVMNCNLNSINNSNYPLDDNADFQSSYVKNGMNNNSEKTKSDKRTGATSQTNSNTATVPHPPHHYTVSEVMENNSIALSHTNSPSKVIYPSIYPSEKGGEVDDMSAGEYSSLQNLPSKNNSAYAASQGSSSSSQMPGINKGGNGSTGNMNRRTGNPSGGGAGGGGGGGGFGSENYDFQVVFSMGKGASRPIELSAGVGWTQGMRPTMEDEHFCKLNSKIVREQPISFLGILDGHCGKRVAELGSKYLPDMFFSHCAIGDNNALAMVESILQADHSIYHTLSGRQDANSSWFGSLVDSRTSTGGSYVGCNSKFTEATPSGGSTLICAAVHGRMLYVACLGDARAVVLDGKTTIPMSEDHKPGNTKEIQRIQRCGGFVQFGRVCGVLAVSRALGDFEFKSSSSGGTSQRQNASRNLFSFARAAGSLTNNGPLTPNEYMVSNVADVRQLALTDDSNFLILACDGLWDVVSNEEATQFVQDFLSYTPEVNDLLVLHGKRPKPSPSVIHRVLCNCSQKLAEFAVERGSTDNVSVMVLFFHDVVETVVRFSQLHQLGIPIQPYSDGMGQTYGSPTGHRRKNKRSATGVDSLYSSSSSLSSFSSPLQGYPSAQGMNYSSSLGGFSLPTPGHLARRSVVGGGGGVNDMRSSLSHSHTGSGLPGSNLGSSNSGGNSRGWLPSPHLLRNTPSSVAEVGVVAGSSVGQNKNRKDPFPKGYNNRARAMR